MFFLKRLDNYIIFILFIVLFLYLDLIIWLIILNYK